MKSSYTVIYLYKGKETSPYGIKPGSYGYREYIVERSEVVKWFHAGHKWEDHNIVAIVNAPGPLVELLNR